MNASAQGVTIGYMVLCGLGMGTVFDFYRVAVHRFRISRWMLPGLDLVYWAAAVLAVFYLLLSTSGGEVRLYIFLGLGIGISGYFGLLSTRAIKLFRWLLERCVRLLRLIWHVLDKMLLLPVRFVVKLLASVLDIVFVVVAALLLWSGRLLGRPFLALGRKLWIGTLPVRKRLHPIAAACTRIGLKLKKIWQILRSKP